MAGFLEKFGSKVGEVLNSTAETVGDFTQETKLKMEINKYNSQIKELMSKLGTDIVEARLSGASSDSVLAMLDGSCEKVKGLKAEIERVEKSIDELKSKSDSGEKNSCTSSCCSSAKTEPSAEPCAEKTDSTKCECTCESEKTEL